MRRIAALPTFQRSLKKLSPLEKAQLEERLVQFKAFVYRGVVSGGLGFKKLDQDIYEFRVGLRLRVLVLAEKDVYYLVLIGSHDEVSRYLRKIR
jgi:mRNA-degrading endonuclease RelE of RelBE toxin-antitoxin system